MGTLFTIKGFIQYTQRKTDCWAQLGAVDNYSHLRILPSYLVEERSYD